MPKKHISLILELDDGVCVDLTVFKWANNLTDMQKLFVFYYANQGTKKNAAQAARCAGYKSSSANVQGSQLLKNPQIIAEINNISSQIVQNITKSKIENTFRELLDIQLKHLNFYPIDLYKIESFTNKDGKNNTRAIPKSPEELTDEQKQQIIDLVFLDSKGTFYYRVPDKMQIENNLLKMWKSTMDIKAADSQNLFDVETTAQIIGEKLNMKTRVIKTNEKIAQDSDISTFDGEEREEEL